MHKGFLKWGAVFGMLSVMLGAFAAHGLKQRIGVTELQVFETGVRYQFYHAFALIIVGILFQKFNSKLLKPAGYCFLGGICLFSGSLYGLVWTQAKGLAGFNWLGPVTPLGGLLFIMGWLLLLISFFQKPVDNQ
ncbi:MAG: DUF423 domain-containing protein [Chitinophagaceae bacterium]|nr:DUF423 domain-containing protein [Bacteroidota bacterium]MCC6258714.1 DUF423 domain-containing protein [Chitinophagaceae bacterium]MCW5916065.1 DUF423 domain-containing protein [Ferruginibacter sp.]